MSIIPSVEAMLLQVHQSLGCEPYQTKKKNNFATGQGRLKGHFEMGTEILHSIFDTLDIDPQSRLDLLGNLENLGNAHKAIELKTWTFAADQRQILWMLLGYFYVPGLARLSAFWSLENAFDKGMPGGQFWFLPEIREVDGKPSLYMPVAQVVDWLLDLLGMPLDEFADLRSSATDTAHEGLRRTLYNWRNDTVPRPSTFLKYLGDEQALHFNGAFLLEEGFSAEARFSRALEFIRRKGLTAEALRQQIPMTQPDRLERILRGDAGDAEEAEFVSRLLDRYAKPSMQVIRNRLLVARLIQDGYGRLLKALFPSVDRSCTDKFRNKILQLVDIYKLIYNLTVDAHKTCGEQGVEEEDAWFEEKLTPLYANGIFLSIAPSKRVFANSELAELMIRNFSQCKHGDELEDHFVIEVEASALIIQRNMERLKDGIDESIAEVKLVERLKKASPWRTLQGESRMQVLLQVGHNKTLGQKVRQAVVQRLREVAETPSDVMKAAFMELDGYLNHRLGNRHENASERVKVLVAEAESSPDYELWKAPVLQYKAKHFLACNDFEGAVKLLKAALDACNDRCYGALRGEIARDCWAVEVANRKLIVNNHEKYYREMLSGNMINVGKDGILPGIEDMAREISQYFWEDLYKPYPGERFQMPLAVDVFRKMLNELVPLLSRNDKAGLENWIKVNGNALKSGLPDVCGDSFLTIFLKLHSTIKEIMEPALSEQIRSFIALLARQAPKQLNLADFKGQTPLMLAAEAGDADLLKIMLAGGADPDMQDYRGMTALHSAIKLHANDCVDVLLEHPCRLDLLTGDGRSPLHTASWSANAYGVSQLLRRAPELAWQRNSEGMTPLELVECLIEDAEGLKLLNAESCRNGGRPVSSHELETVAELLESASFAVKK